MAKKPAVVDEEDIFAELGLEEELVPVIKPLQLRRGQQQDIDVTFYNEENSGKDEGGLEVEDAMEDMADRDDYEEGEVGDSSGYDVQERNVRERVSGFANEESGPMEGMSNRMFYAIRNTNRSEEDLFLDVFEKYCYTHVPRLDYTRQNHPFQRLLTNHPHPRFLNIPLCLAATRFYNERSREYKWDPVLFNEFQSVHTPHDIYRYLAIFNQYG